MDAQRVDGTGGEPPERPALPGEPEPMSAALAGIVRQVRRVADLSQRELAARVVVSASAIAKIELGRHPTLTLLIRILDVAGFRLLVVDQANRRVQPLKTWDGITDLADRRFPAHLDTILDPDTGEWWADVFGLTNPPETFRRNRAIRDYERQRSRWEVRVAQLRNEPRPSRPVTPRPPTPRDDCDF